MRIVEFLVPLLACRAEIVAADCDDVVTAIGRGVPDRFVLAHQEDCY